MPGHQCESRTIEAAQPRGGGHDACGVVYLEARERLRVTPRWQWPRRRPQWGPPGLSRLRRWDRRTGDPRMPNLVGRDRRLAGKPTTGSRCSPSRLWMPCKTGAAGLAGRGPQRSHCLEGSWRTQVCGVLRHIDDDSRQYDRRDGCFRDRAGVGWARRTAAVLGWG